MTSPRTVFVIDDDPQMRQFLELTLQKSGLRVVSFASAEDFLARASEHGYRASCLLLDVRMPGIGGLGLQEILNRDGILVPIVFLSVAAEIPVIVQALQAGAVDFLPKTTPWDRLVPRIERAVDLATRWQAEKAATLDYESRLSQLTLQERKVFDLLIAGRNTKEIGSELEISNPTVARHRSSVFRKLKVRNAVELARQAWQYALKESDAATPRPFGASHPGATRIAGHLAPTESSPPPH